MYVYAPKKDNVSVFSLSHLNHGCWQGWHGIGPPIKSCRPGLDPTIRCGRLETKAILELCLRDWIYLFWHSPISGVKEWFGWQSKCAMLDVPATDVNALQRKNTNRAYGVGSDFGITCSLFGSNHISWPLMLAGDLPPADSHSPIEELDRLLLGLTWPALASFLGKSWIPQLHMRLAAGVGTGNSTAKHARSVGELFSSGVFNKTLSSIKEIIYLRVCNHGYTFLQIFFKLYACRFSWPAMLSPNETSETAMHNKAKRTGLTLQCEMSYHDLPICTGYDDDGKPVIEMKSWPFVLPNNMATGLTFKVYIDIYSWQTLTCCIFVFSDYSLSLEHPIEAQALLDDGFLDILVDLSKLDEYWAHMLQEYPGHPAAAKPSEVSPDHVVWPLAKDWYMIWG